MLGSKTFDCIFNGYAQNSVAYRFMCLNDKTISESRDAKFFEHVFPLKKIKSTFVPSLYSSMCDLANSSTISKTFEYETVNNSNAICELEPRKSKRQRTDKSFGMDFLSTFAVERYEKIDCNFMSLNLIDEDSKTY